jgi:ankyrin repeat protein
VLLDAGADVNARNEFDATALVWAAGNAEKVRLLVGKGARVNVKTKQGRTPLIVAASHNGALPILQFLLAHDADPHVVDVSGNTPLIAAAQANDEASVRLLLDQHVDVNARNANGETALMSAAANGNLTAVKLLLTAGARANDVSSVASVNVKAGPIALGKYTALLLAAPQGSPELVRALLDAGAELNARDIRGMTPLMMSVSSEYQRPEVVRLLIAKGASPMEASLAGETAIDWAGKFSHPNVTSLFAGSAQQERHMVAARPLTKATAAPGEIGRALQKSFTLLQNANRSFFQGGGCAGCHHQQLINDGGATSGP